MKQIFTACCTISIALFACNTQPTTTNTTTTPSADTTKPADMKIMVPAQACYASIGKDSVFLKGETFPNVVTGNLSYKIFEKDSNKGTFDGKMSGDTLVADYTFMSEGMSSVRQVIFLIKDGVATEGYGAMEEKNGKTIFSDSKAIDFSKGIKLKLVDCGGK